MGVEPVRSASTWSVAGDGRARYAVVMGGGELEGPTIVTSGGATREPDAEEASLVVLRGKPLGRRIPLGRGSVIGRGPMCEISLDDDGASRVHARVWRQGGAYVVKDLGSTNGTWVNDEKIGSSVRPLNGGDRLQVGRTIFRVLVGGSVEEQFHREIYRMMTVDGLTGLVRKERFDERLALECAAAERYGGTVSVVLLDIDHFKRVNDEFGHLAGDAVLRGVAERVLGSIRVTDQAARWGGEEIAVLSPQVGSAGALALAEKLRRAVEGAPFVVDGEEIPVTVSGGTATFRPKMSVAELVRCADHRLYAAKAGGRNRCFGATPGEDIEVL